MNIARILSYCHDGTKLYSPIFGDVTLEYVNSESIIVVKVTCNDNTEQLSLFDSNGVYLNKCNGECLLFPSKDQRDWSKFKIPTKNGDIMMTNDGRAFICSGIMDNDNSPAAHGGLTLDNYFTRWTTNQVWTHSQFIPATDTARNKLFKAMASRGLKWNSEKLCIEEL